MTKAGTALLVSTILTALLVTAGCAVSSTEKSVEDEGRLDTSTSALVEFNPCHPDWQLPTSARWALDIRDPAFLAFENRLEADGARWIGSYSLPKPYRAIVQVDTYREYTKKDPRSGLWYLAAIPVASFDARRAVNDFRYVSPVLSRELGYCKADGTFIPNNGNGPPNVTITHVITKYDPRCTCTGTPTAGIPVWVTSPEYSSTPYW